MWISFYQIICFKREKELKKAKKPRNFVVFQVFYPVKAGIADAKLVPSRLQQAIK
jgi:hypothetical protein